MVEQVSMNSLLRQMQEIKAKANGAQEDLMPGQINDQALPREEINFSEVMKNAIDKVNATQKEAGQLAKSFERGDPDVDITQVMIALQKSSVSFQAMLQVRNKLVEAYKDVMSMSL